MTGLLRVRRNFFRRSQIDDAPRGNPLRAAPVRAPRAVCRRRNTSRARPAAASGTTARGTSRDGPWRSRRCSRRSRGSSMPVRSNQPASLSAMAIVSGSSPVAHGTLQMRIGRLVVAARAPAAPYTRSPESASIPRQKDVSWTERASMTRAIRPPARALRTSAGSKSREKTGNRARERAARCGPSASRSGRCRKQTRYVRE